MCSTIPFKMLHQVSLTDRPEPSPSVKLPWYNYLRRRMPWGMGCIIDIESLQNRLFKVCYVPATRASLPRVSFFFSFLFFVAAAIDSSNEANKVT
jgi:hypothetical protein